MEHICPISLEKLIDFSVFDKVLLVIESVYIIVSSTINQGYWRQLPNSIFYLGMQTIHLGMPFYTN